MSSNVLSLNTNIQFTAFVLFHICQCWWPFPTVCVCVFVCEPTNRKTLLSGLTLCFSMYLIKLLFAYLFDEKKEIHILHVGLYVSDLRSTQACTHVVLLKSFCSVGYSGIFLMSSQSLSVEHKSTETSMPISDLTENTQILWKEPSTVKSERNTCISILWRKQGPLMLQH